MLGTFKIPDFINDLAIGWGGLIIIVLLSFLLGYLAHRGLTRRKYNSLIFEDLRIQAIQAQMNPHFFFNLLITLQNLSLTVERSKIAEIIAELADMVRLFLESSINTDLSKSARKISLADELKIVGRYVHFEDMQYPGNFDWVLKIAPNVNPSMIRIPPFMIQPYVENAIKHGIIPLRDRKGQLELRIFMTRQDILTIILIDNGIGREAAALNKQKQLKSYKSRGTDLLEQRVKLLNKVGENIDITITDQEEGGVIVTVSIASYE